MGERNVRGKVRFRDAADFFFDVPHFGEGLVGVKGVLEVRESEFRAFHRFVDEFAFVFVPRLRGTVGVCEHSFLEEFVNCVASDFRFVETCGLGEKS